MTTEALPILRLGMKRMLISLCLSGAVISPPTALDFSPAPNLHGDDVIDDVISVAIIGYGSSSSPLQSTEIVALPCEQDEVHAVVVDMPQVISLAYASPETWGSLSMPVEPYEQPPATPGFQLATNAAILTVSN